MFGPEWVAEIVDVRPKGGNLAVVDVLVYTGMESPWQPPARDRVRTTIPAGANPRPGQRVVISPTRGPQTQSYIHWDRPEPPPPTMQFPNIPGGDDPKTMLAHLRNLVATGALDQEGYERAQAYLEPRAG